MACASQLLADKCLTQQLFPSDAVVGTKTDQHCMPSSIFVHIFATPHPKTGHHRNFNLKSSQLTVLVGWWYCTNAQNEYAPLPDQLLLLARLSRHKLPREEMTMTHTLRISQDVFSSFSAKCWVTKCPSNGYLSQILGRPKRTYSTRQLCSYLLNYVGNYIIGDELPSRVGLHQLVVGWLEQIQKRIVSKRRRMFKTYG